MCVTSYSSSSSLAMMIKSKPQRWIDKKKEYTQKLKREEKKDRNDAMHECDLFALFQSGKFNSDLATRTKSTFMHLTQFLSSSAHSCLSCVVAFVVIIYIYTVVFICVDPENCRSNSMEFKMFARITSLFREGKSQPCSIRLLFFFICLCRLKCHHNARAEQERMPQWSKFKMVHRSLVTTLQIELHDSADSAMRTNFCRMYLFCFWWLG